MWLPEIDWAIYKRLTGYPLDSEGRPRLDANGVPVNREVVGPPRLYAHDRVWDSVTQTFTTRAPMLPSYGIRVPIILGNTPMTGVSTRRPAFRPHSGYNPSSFRPVPVFDVNVTGRDWEQVWPCVTFEWAGLYLQQWNVYHDPFRADDTTSPAVELTNRNGDVVDSGTKRIRVRPHPESHTALYTIRVRSRVLVEAEWMAADLLRLFPEKGVLVVTFADGSTHPCDMILERMENLDGPQVGSGLERSRNVERQFVYRIEAYEDNTVGEYGVQGSASEPRTTVSVVEAILQLEEASAGAIHTPSADMTQFQYPEED